VMTECIQHYVLLNGNLKARGQQHRRLRQQQPSGALRKTFVAFVALSENDLASLQQNGPPKILCFRESYYDTHDFRLAQKGYWLRCRNGASWILRQTTSEQNMLVIKDISTNPDEIAGILKRKFEIYLNGESLHLGPTSIKAEFIATRLMFSDELYIDAVDIGHNWGKCSLCCVISIAESNLSSTPTTEIVKLLWDRPVEPACSKLGMYLAAQDGYGDLKQFLVTNVKQVLTIKKPDWFGKLEYNPTSVSSVDRKKAEALYKCLQHVPLNPNAVAHEMLKYVSKELLPSAMFQLQASVYKMTRTMLLQSHSPPTSVSASDPPATSQPELICQLCRTIARCINCNSKPKEVKIRNLFDEDQLDCYPETDLDNDCMASVEDTLYPILFAISDECDWQSDSKYGIEVNQI